MGQGWASKVVAAGEVVIMILKLNVWWWLITLAGLVVLGVGPATATAAVLVRRWDRGEPVTFRSAVAIARREFASANLALAPVLIMLLVLVGHLTWFDTLPGVGPVTAVAALITAALCGFLGPLYAHYALPRHRYVLQAVRLMIIRPLWTVLMILAAVAVGVLGTFAPVLVPLAGVGGWLVLTNWLGLRCFADNERRLANATTDAAAVPLPTEPLRMH